MTPTPGTGNGPTAAVALRRQQVAELWLRGVPTAAIARELETPETTIRRDLTAIKADLLATHHAEIEHARARSLAVLRTVQREAWGAFTEAKANSNAKPGYLNAILAAEQLVAKIEGIVQPDVTQQTTVNVLSAPEWAGIRTAVLAALSAHPEARQAVIDALSAPGRTVDADERNDESEAAG